MGEPDRSGQLPPGSKKHSIDDIIDHMTADLQSYDGQYLLLGSPPNPPHVWPQSVHNPVFVQQPYDIQDRKIQDFPHQPPPGLFYPNPPRVHENSGEMIGMVDVGGGNFVNVVFNPSNPPNPMHPFLPSHHSDPNLGYIHYQQQPPAQPQPQPQQQNPQMSTGSSIHRDYGLFNTTSEPTSQNNHQLIENVVGNWLPNKSGTYSPFGNVSHPQSEVKEEDRTVRPAQPGQVKKPRIVAEVRPMRPSYSDVLAKSVVPPLTPPPTATKPIVPTGTVTKTEGRKQSTKGVKVGSNNGAPKTGNHPSLKRQQSNNEDQTKTNVRRWISLDDLTPPQSSEENSFVDYDSYLDDNVGSGSDNYIQPPAGEVKKEKKQKKKTKLPDKYEALNNHKTSGGTNGGNKRPLHIKDNLQGKTGSSEKNVTKSASKNTRSQEENKKGLSNGGVGGGSKSNVSTEERGPSVSRVSRGGSSSGARRGQRAKRKDGQSYLAVLCKRWQEQMSYYGLMFLTWFLHLIWDVLAMSARLLVHLFSVMCETGLVWLQWLQCKVTGLIGREPWWNWWGKKPTPPPKNSEPPLPGGLTCNISLPATGDEAMKRLLACKGKDPYSILGVTNNCTDDDIKKYYKRQAVLVHPDKNSQPGAEEAFKILVHAFELIGEPERRSAYDRCVAETHQVEQAWSELSELLSQLHHKMEYAANTIRCTNCGKRHKRVIMQRPCYAARFCAQCKIHHSAREGDIWAESWMLGLLWHYYACMEGAVYDITEWATCQADNLKHLKANSHAVQYRIVLGKQNHHHHLARDNYNEPDLEEFLNNLYAQSGVGGGDGGTTSDSNSRQRRKGKRKK
ncbi:dnaJ homolog dnj-5 isoform X2 [Macrosteles quadrilineatus]|uniref:dnaJ homolog dnj-5 isoform X2 n=1 Tax=Macrosteles quadrilineatus TaxID=74068 RepID=UPI0023E128A6|nr:dnaJ homolog dnj-5 isoform X2 [Macrosteles quadrilineatus]